MSGNGIVPQLAAVDIAPLAGADTPFTSGIYGLEAGDLAAAVEAACEECRDLTIHAMDPRYPPAPPLPVESRTTAHGLFQNIKLFIDAYYDRRTLSGTTDYSSGIDQYTRYSALGPLTFALERAIMRTLERGASGPGPVLAIGAGQRLVEAQLKHIFGDQIRLYEVSPKYGALEGVIDVLLPPSGIDEAVLPENHFELVYSFFGNLYGENQLRIMQKVLYSLRVGGEAFLMWKHGISTNRMASLTRLYNRLFHDEGLDISVDSGDFTGVAATRDRVHTVWIRKRQTDVDVESIFKKARAVDALKKKPTLAPTIRFSLDGPYFPSRSLLPNQLAGIVDSMIASAARAMGRTSEGLEQQLLKGQAVFRPDIEAFEASALALFILRENHLLERNRGVTSQLEYNVPLSIAVTDFLHNAIRVPYTSEARCKALLRTHIAIARH